MKRIVHKFSLLGKTHSNIHWHRYEDGVLWPAGYTAHVSITRDTFGNTALWDEVVRDIHSLAQDLVHDHEANTWATRQVDAIEISHVNVIWHSLADSYEKGEVPNIELSWQRVRRGKALPRWCDGVLLYEYDPIEKGYKVNVDKGYVVDPARVQNIAQKVFAMLRAATRWADYLDEEVGWS